jgi:iron complex transport system substrate-binding protein
MRICSLLPSGTETLFALGLGDSVMGVTFECDYPTEARTKPIVVRSKLAHGLPQREIDRTVKEFSARAESLYRLDTEKLQEIKPDLIITQDLCHVCAAAPGDLGAVLGLISPAPNVLSLSPRTVANAWSDIITVGEATCRPAAARKLVSTLECRIARVKRSRSSHSPRVLCLEWMEPPFVGGHWVPEMVELAGGIDVLGRAGDPGNETDWQTIAAANPDVILVMPCGYHQIEVEAELQKIQFPAEWHSLRAVRKGNVFAMDASSYFSRPGPRIADGIEIMSGLFERISRQQIKKSVSGVRMSPDRIAKADQPQ